MQVAAAHFASVAYTRGRAGADASMHNIVPGEDPYQVVELVLER